MKKSAYLIKPPFKKLCSYFLTLLFASFILPQALQAQICGDAILDAGEECDGGETDQYRAFDIESPTDLIIGNDGNIFGVSQGTDPFVFVINAESGAVSTFIPNTDGTNYTFSSGLNAVIQGPDGTFYVSDGAPAAAVYHFDAAGNFIEFNAQIFDPRGLGLHPDGTRLLVADSNILWEIPLDNFVMGDIFYNGVGLDGPSDFIFTPSEILVTNAGADNITRHDLLLGGNLLGVFVASGPGGSDAEINGPRTIVFRPAVGLGAEDQVCIANTLLSNVLCYNFDDAFLNPTVLDAGILGDTLDITRGLVFDAADNLWVGSNGNDRVYKYIINGENSDNPNATCRADCTDQGCGDGIVDDDFGEECDDENADDTDDCVGACQIAFCGDGFVQAGVEGCDDGNADNTDSCPDGAVGTCQPAECGDGFVQDGVEDCDGGLNCDPVTCEAVGIIVGSCGDGIVGNTAGEECDEGPANSDDANATCRTDCTDQACGDGITDDGLEESCDDGNADDTDDCLNTCQNASCGDGILQVGVEECDGGEDCDASCQLIDDPTDNDDDDGLDEQVDDVLDEDPINGGGGCTLSASAQSGTFGTSLTGLALIMGFASWRFRRRS